MLKILFFSLIFLLPSGVSLYYWLLLSPDRYITESGFVVRTVSETSGGDIFNNITGLTGGSSTSSDTSIVISFLHSRDLVEEVNKQINLLDIFNKTNDLFYKFGEGSIEDLVKYWRKRVVITYDTTTGLVTYEIQAFTPEDSLIISKIVLKEIKKVINQISQESREAVLKNAQEEVGKAEQRLRDITKSQKQFRTEQRSLNPFGSSNNLVEQISIIEGKISNTKREIDTLVKQDINPDSNVFKRAMLKLETLNTQIGKLKSQSGINAEKMAEFEHLELDKQFAQELYTTSLITLQQAQTRSDSLQKYLAVFKHPKLAETSTIPNRILNSFVSIFVFFIIWSITSLLFYHIRDKRL